MDGSTRDLHHRKRELAVAEETDIGDRDNAHEIGVFQPPKSRRNSDFVDA
jgi:hypothetical protein